METPKRRWKGGVAALVLGSVLVLAGCGGMMSDGMMQGGDMKKDGGMMKDDKMMEKK